MMLESMILKLVENLTTEDDSDEEVNLEVKDTMTLLNEYVDETRYDG